MNKFLQLYRLSFKNRLTVIGYYFSRIFRIRVSENQKSVNELYNHLLFCDGILKSETKDNYIVYLQKEKFTLYIRKRPSSDLSVFGQVFRGKEYHDTIKMYKEHFGSGTVNCIDAGANVGYTSVLLAAHFPDASIVAVEPGDENFAMLEKNARGNNSKIDLWKGGIWNKNTYLKIVRDFRDKSDWAIRVEETNDTGELRAFTINQIISDKGWTSVDILKMDIEGSEKQVFSSGSDLSFLTMTKCIAIEIHDEFDCRDDINRILIDNHFELSRSGELTIGYNKSLL